VYLCSLLEFMNTEIFPASVRFVCHGRPLVSSGSFNAGAGCRVASLVEKRTTRSNGFKASYVGYSVPDK
jgi:hypothetical protein